MKLSVCIITKNEESNLPRALASVSRVADEIVILDSGSTDQTVEIAKNFHAKVFIEEWRGYAAQKTRAMQLASHSWILFLDADEALSDELQIEINHLKEKELSVDGFMILRVSHMLGEKIYFGDWYPDWLIRLVRKEKAHFSNSSVHERLEVEGKTCKLKGELLHWPYKDFDHQKKKVTQYAELWARDAYAQGKRANILSPWLHGIWRFFKWMILRRGYQGGILGLKLGFACAYETFLKYETLHNIALSSSKPTQT